jgi:predicted hydrolase (HD superfamily)
MTAVACLLAWATDVRQQQIERAKEVASELMRINRCAERCIASVRAQRAVELIDEMLASNDDVAYIAAALYRALLRHDAHQIEREMARGYLHDIVSDLAPDEPDEQPDEDALRFEQEELAGDDWRRP